MVASASNTNYIQVCKKCGVNYIADPEDVTTSSYHVCDGVTVISTAFDGNKYDVVPGTRHPKKRLKKNRERNERDEAVLKYNPFFKGKLK